MTRAGATCGIAAVVCLILTAAAGADILVVPVDYSEINEAIAAANEGDTVFVEPGIYQEQVVIDKRLTVLGRNCNVTVIDGNADNDRAVILTANGIVLKGLTVTGGGNDDSPEYFGAGIGILGADSCLIENCRIVENPLAGIFAASVNHSTIRYCKFFHNSYDICTGFLEGHPPGSMEFTNNLIEHCEFRDFYKQGIAFEHDAWEDSCVVRNNLFTTPHANTTSMLFWTAQNNLVFDNQFYSCDGPAIQL